MPVFCLFTLGRHGNFTAGVTMSMEQPDLLCTALALNIELLSIIVCAVLQTSYQNNRYITDLTGFFFHIQTPTVLNIFVSFILIFSYFQMSFSVPLTLFFNEVNICVTSYFMYGVSHEGKYCTFNKILVRKLKYQQKATQFINRCHESQFYVMCI